MYARSALLLSALTVLLSSGCTPAPTASADTHDADVKAIKDTETAWNQTFAAKDVDKTAGFYTDDASLMIPNEPIASGREATKAALKQLLSDPNFALHFEAVKVDTSKSGDMGYTQGTYTLIVTDPATKKPITDKGKYVTIYKKQVDGSWKAAQDIVNSDLPMPAPTK